MLCQKKKKSFMSFDHITGEEEEEKNGSVRKILHRYIF